MSDLLPSSSPPAYRVLARKYRPQRFEDLIGQEAMVRTLANAIQTNRLPQAWMLTGVRGIGKTTTARLVARALNCTAQDGPTITPCGVCDACKAIAEDRHVDVQEMDAASRTSVDDIREIIEGVRYGPVSARYKLYILDEVHMLSKNAFNALLKTLEEPPPHTKFIFATTEIRKVPVTVLSRCQRFDLRRIEAAELTRHFGKIAGLEKVEAEEEALRLIAQAADGSVRDGLSLLDQAIARGGEKILAEDVRDMLGLADQRLSLDICRTLFKGPMKEVLELYRTSLQSGADPLQVLHDLANLIPLLTRAQAVPDLAVSAERTEGERKLLADLAEIKIPALTRSWQILLKGLNEAQAAPNPADAVEMALIRLAYAAELPPTGDLVKAIKDQMAQNASTAPTLTPQGSGPQGSRTALRGNAALAAVPVMAPAAPQAVPLMPEGVPLADPQTFREAVALFADNREGTLFGHLYSYVHPIRFAPGILEIRVDPGAPDNLAQRVSQGLSQWTGQRWMVTLGREPGGRTLAEEDKEIELARFAKAESHPLMQALKTHFPDAKLRGLKAKEVVIEQPPAKEEEAVFETDEEEI